MVIYGLTNIQTYIGSDTIIYRVATYQIATSPTNSITINATHSTAY